MEARDILIKAVQAVDEAGVPQEFRLTAFEKAVELVAAGIAGKSHPISVSTGHQERPGNVRPTSALELIASRLKIDVDLLGDIYHEHDGELEIIVPSTKLEHGKKGGTRQLALLVAAGRQAAGIEDFTSFDRVREVAEQYRRYDSPNFARTINEMEDEFSFRGDSRNREIRVSRPGWELASKLVNALAGGEG